MRGDAALGLEASGGQNASHAPDKAAAYADPSYWDRRFGVETEYEWCRYAPSQYEVYINRPCSLSSDTLQS